MEAEAAEVDIDSIFSPNESVDNQSGGGGELEKNGLYKVKVLSAFDSYKVNEGEAEDPDRNRCINLRLKVLEPVLDTTGDVSETEADFEARKSEKGKTVDVRVWLSRDGNASLLEGNLDILTSIAGSTDKPSDEIMEKASVDGGQHRLGVIGDEANINCTRLLGRDAVVKVQSVQDDWPGLFPWVSAAVSDDEQTPFDSPLNDEDAQPQPSGPLFSGEDLASKHMKEVFNSEGGGSNPPDTEYDEDGRPGPDDDLPF